MSTYTFTKSDLDKSMKDFFANKGVMMSSGLTKDIEEKIRNIERLFTSDWKYTICVKNVQPFGFASLDELKKAIVNSCLAYAVSSTCTLRDELAFYHDKSLGFFPDQPVPDVPEEGDISQYLLNFSVEQLFSIGW